MSDASNAARERQLAETSEPMIPRDRRGRCAMSAPLQRVAFKNAQKLVDEASELFERFNDRLAVGNLRLIERYVDGRLNLFLEARWGTIDFYIVCQRAHDLSAGGNAPVGSDWPAATFRSQSPVRPDEHAGHSTPNECNSMRGPYRQDALVFVDDVEMVEFPETEIPTFVWF
jgi:hypothetical protein